MLNISQTFQGHSGMLGKRGPRLRIQIHEKNSGAFHCLVTVSTKCKHTRLSATDFWRIRSATILSFFSSSWANEMMACGQRSSSRSMELSVCPSRVAHSTCTLSPALSESGSCSRRGRMEDTSNVGPHNSDYSTHRRRGTPLKKPGAG